MMATLRPGSDPTLRLAQVAEGLDDAVAVTRASIGIKTDDYTKYVALGFNLYAAIDPKLHRSIRPKQASCASERDEVAPLSA